MEELSPNISAIVPTIGRPESLARLLRSLAAQTHRVDEVVVADGGSDDATAKLLEDSRWKNLGLVIKRILVRPANAVRQREAAIEASRGELLLMLDDDVELEPQCVEQLVAGLAARADVVAATATLGNQPWPRPIRAWRAYMRLFYGIRGESWQGRVIGPLLRYGYVDELTFPTPMDWLGAGSSLIPRHQFVAAGGFSDFFFDRATINEDVDLSIKLRKNGIIIFCPQARLYHHHAPGGRLTAYESARDDIYNRYQILRQTMGKSRAVSASLVATYWTIENGSAFLGGLMRLRGLGRIANRAAGGLHGLLAAFRLVNRS